MKKHESEADIFTRTLEVRLYRALCPPSQSLADYAAGFLLPVEMNNVQTHLTDCMHCTAETQQLQEAMSDLGFEFVPGPTPLSGSRIGENSTARRAHTGVFATVRDWINSFHNALDAFERSLTPGMQPAFGGVRADAAVIADAPHSTHNHVYTAHDTEIHLDVEPDPEAPGHVIVIGAVLAASEADDDLWFNVPVSLYSIAPTIAAFTVDAPYVATTDAAASFVMRGVVPGSYAFSVEGATQSILIEDVFL